MVAIPRVRVIAIEIGPDQATARGRTEKLGQEQEMPPAPGLTWMKLAR